MANSLDTTEKELEQKLKRREKKKNPKMKMHGKGTREIPKLWRKQAKTISVKVD